MSQLNDDQRAAMREKMMKAIATALKNVRAQRDPAFISHLYGIAVGHIAACRTLELISYEESNRLYTLATGATALAREDARHA